MAAEWNPDRLVFALHWQCHQAEGLSSSSSILKDSDASNDRRGEMQQIWTTVEEGQRESPYQCTLQVILSLRKHREVC